MLGLWRISAPRQLRGQISRYRRLPPCVTPQRSSNLLVVTGLTRRRLMGLSTQFPVYLCVNPLSPSVMDS